MRCRRGAAHGGGYEGVVVSALDAAEIERIETAVREWRQGDATLDAGTFLIHLADKRAPLTAEARGSVDEAPAEHNVFDVFSPVRGLAVVTQSCDIVKKCASSECVEVSPLVLIEDEAELYAIQKRRRPPYAYLPGVAAHKLVVDLERTMTVEKAVVAGWNRIPGCTTDAERRTFAEALARKRQRFAFPDGFNLGLRKFRDRIKRSEGKATPEGHLIGALDEIRAKPSPNWDAPKVTVFFWFLLEPQRVTDLDTARKVIENWMKMISLPNSFALADPSFDMVEPQDMTVDDYLNSHALDYDDVSP